MNDQFAVSGRGGSFIEACVDQGVAGLAADQPDEKIENSGLLMRIRRAEKIVIDAPPAVIGVANSVDFTRPAHVPFLRFLRCRENHSAASASCSTPALERAIVSAAPSHYLPLSIGAR